MTVTCVVVKVLGGGGREGGHWMTVTCCSEGVWGGGRGREDIG